MVKIKRSSSGSGRYTALVIVGPSGSVVERAIAASISSKVFLTPGPSTIGSPDSDELNSVLVCFVEDMGYIRELRVSRSWIPFSLGERHAILVQIDNNLYACIFAVHVRRLMIVHIE